ncbi:MAG: DUF5915 domain-containing protein, partial [Gammaproteobacteria bacterium]|nr:DUF5915 domain-containing protein [Gammaproteobacteria bacterium]
EDLTNWYIRLNRSRFWAEGRSRDKSAAYHTLYTTIFELSVSMAPFAPFLSESIFGSLSKFESGALPESVHLCHYPEANEARIKPLLEQAVTRMQHIILLGRQKRNNEKVKTKYPLPGLTVAHRDQELLDEIARLEDYIQAELNVKKVDYSTDEQRYIHLHARPNSPVLGKRFGKRFKTIKASIESLSTEAIDQLQKDGSMELDGETLTTDDVLVFREAREGTNAVSDSFISIDMDCRLDEELKREGLAREVVNRIQKSRKDSGFNVSDRIRLTVHASPALVTAIKEHAEYVQRETLTVDLVFSDDLQPLAFDVDEERLTLALEVSTAG